MKFSPLSLLWIACFGTLASAQAAPKIFPGPGISFTYDDALIKAPKAHRVKAVPLAIPTDIPDGVAPAHIFIEFGNDRGEIHVYPTTDPGVKSFRKAYPEHTGAEKDLRKLLHDRPTESKELPLLPWADVGMPFNKKIRYLDFHGGSGVAWLTLLDTETSPINNSQLWYIFQGLTKDGSHYVAVQIRVAHPSLPATSTVKDYHAFEKQYQAYLPKAVKEIASQRDDSFQPSLTALRSFFESIEVQAAP